MSRRFFFRRPSALQKRGTLAWVEESFSFDRPIGKQIATHGNRAHVGSSLAEKSLLFYAAMFGIAFVVLFWRLADLQLVRGYAFYAAAEENRQHIVPIPSERGIILDRTGRPLTRNVPNFSLALIPQHVPRDPALRRELVLRLAEITKRPEAEILQAVEEYRAYSYESIVIQENVDYETALSLQIAAADLPGIHIIRGSKRQYIHELESGLLPFGATTTRSLSHLIGYEGKLNREELDALYAEGYIPSDLIGKTGVEKTYESYLRGLYGKKRIEVNAVGHEQTVLAEIPPTPGYHVSLSIDAAVQGALESILSQSLTANKKARASAVALDPRTGEIVALVSLPAFDNNDFSGGISSERYATYRDDPHQPLFNRVIGGTYPSGSTIKPAIASAALQEGIITRTTTFLSTGGLRIGAWFFPDWRPGGHGSTNVIHSLEDSVNTFYYYIGGGYERFAGLGVSRIADYLKRFGFGSVLGIDIPGEAEGFLPTEEWKKKTKGEVWYIGDTYNLSIGQGDLLVTPLQIAVMTATVANGGTLYRPHVVRAITNPVSHASTFVTPIAVNDHVIDAEHLGIVREGMRACVTGGSCRRLSLLPFAAAGKTGTAQWRSDRDTHAWFTSFAPYDQPEIVLTIMVEEGGEGSGIGAPVAKEFYDWWWQYRHGTAGVDNPI